MRGADKSMMNNARQTPFDVANISGNKEAANILDKHDDLLVGKRCNDLFYLIFIFIIINYNLYVVPIARC